MIRKICLFVIWGLIAVAPVRAAVLTVTPSTQEVNVGGTFTFDLQVSGLGGNPPNLTVTPCMHTKDEA